MHGTMNIEFSVCFAGGWGWGGCGGGGEGGGGKGALSSNAFRFS